MQAKTATMTVKLSDVRSDASGFEQLAVVAQSLEGGSDRAIEVDFSQCNFFDANMAAPLGAILARARSHPETLKIQGLNPHVGTIFSKNEFLSDYALEKSTTSPGFASIPGKQFSTRDSHSFADYLTRNLQDESLPSMPASVYDKLKRSSLEIFANAALHSESECGIFSCGQHLPAEHTVGLTVADAGIGMRQKIVKELGLRLRSDKAIAWAVQEGNTTRKGNIPGGLGLQLIKEFVVGNRGRLQIISDRGLWRIDRFGESTERLSRPLPGTTINIAINTSVLQLNRSTATLTPSNQEVRQ